MVNFLRFLLRSWHHGTIHRFSAVLLHNNLVKVNARCLVLLRAEHPFVLSDKFSIFIYSSFYVLFPRLIIFNPTKYRK